MRVLKYVTYMEEAGSVICKGSLDWKSKFSATDEPKFNSLNVLRYVGRS